jgi:hypothetical protein
LTASPPFTNKNVPRGSTCDPNADVTLLFTTFSSTGVALAAPEPPFVKVACGFPTRRTVNEPVLIIVLLYTVADPCITTLPVVFNVVVDIILPVNVEYVSVENPPAPYDVIVDVVSDE